MSNQTYKIIAFCGNCGFKGEVNIDSGILVEDASCPNCGNNELRKVNPPMRLIPRSDSWR